MNSPGLSPFPDKSWDTFFDQDQTRTTSVNPPASLSSISSECCSPLTPNDAPSDIIWPSDGDSAGILFSGLEDLLLTPPAIGNNDLCGQQATKSDSKYLRASPECMLYGAEHLHFGQTYNPCNGNADEVIDTTNMDYKFSSEDDSPGAETDLHKGNVLETIRLCRTSYNDHRIQRILQDSEPRSSTRPLYIASPDTAGYYHCPFQAATGCKHKPTSIKSTFDKVIDSHTKPFRCKVSGCDIISFSSTACLLRHEREAHGYHGHGTKPFLCEYPPCERARVGNGFPRMYNLIDHMKRVHNHVVEKKPTVKPVLHKVKGSKVNKPRLSSGNVAQRRRHTSAPGPATSRRMDSLAAGAVNNVRVSHSGVTLPCRALDNGIDTVTQTLVDTLPVYRSDVHEHASLLHHRHSLYF